LKDLYSLSSRIFFLGSVWGGAAPPDAEESKDHLLLRYCASKTAHPLSPSDVSPGAKGITNADEQLILF